MERSGGVAWAVRHTLGGETLRKTPQADHSLDMVTNVYSVLNLKVSDGHQPETNQVVGKSRGGKWDFAFSLARPHEGPITCNQNKQDE